MSMMVMSAINMKTQDNKLKTTTYDVTTFKIGKKFLLNILEKNDHQCIMNGIVY